MGRSRKPRNKGLYKSKEPNVIQEPPDESLFVKNHGLMSCVESHVSAYGFAEIVPNIIEAYRHQARRYNAEAEKLENMWKKGE